MKIILFTLILIILYTIGKIVDAFVFPMIYCLNGDRNLDGVKFEAYVPSQR